MRRRRRDVGEPRVRERAVDAALLRVVVVDRRVDGERGDVEQGVGGVGLVPAVPEAQNNNAPSTKKAKANSKRPAKKPTGTLAKPSPKKGDGGTSRSGRVRTSPRNRVVLVTTSLAPAPRDLGPTRTPASEDAARGRA